MTAEGEKETSDDCLQKVVGEFEDLGFQILNEVIDTAHRIGKITLVKGKTSQAMIVRLTTFRHRKIIYRARKNSG